MFGKCSLARKEACVKLGPRKVELVKKLGPFKRRQVLWIGKMLL
jgi:hypothetical protein